jgi:hypothetical protein
MHAMKSSTAHFENIPTDISLFPFWMVNLEQDASSDLNLSDAQRNKMAQNFESLNRAIKDIAKLAAASALQEKANETLQAFAEALGASLRIGAYFPDAPRTKPSQAANRKRVALAHAGRRRDDVHLAIKEEAEALWKRKPSFRRNAEGTAKEIQDMVNARLKKLKKPPKALSVGAIAARIRRP